MDALENISDSDYTNLTALEFNKILSTDYKGVKEKDGRCFWEEQTLKGKCIVFNKIRIKQDLMVKFKNKKKNPSLFIRNSELENIQISEYTLKEVCISNSKIKSLRTEDSNIEDFKVKNVTADYLFINTSTIFNFTLYKFNIRICFEI